ncbi:MAG: serpin family protein, partial [Lachnospiraceae bacterium]|nr:serpin family protein [Lachnospiraceae bacterium]
FLPDEGVSAEELLSDPQVLSLINATAGTAQCTVLKINYAIPKFDVASDTDLSDSLKKLGVTDVFNEGTADFSSVAENSIGMYLSKVDHSVRVLIDEEGVKAAAYTIMPLAGALPPSEEEVDFVLDRPFVFAIRSETGIPLFVGVVELP